jgi:uncharacterized protein (UPF0335 family)
MTTEIEQRIISRHPESLATLAQEVADIFAPVINAMNVTMVLQQQMYQDPDQFINRLNGTLGKLVDRMDNELQRIVSRMDRIEDQQRVIRDALKELARLQTLHGEGKPDGEPE